MFINALHGTNLVELTFLTKSEDVLERKCVPLGYTPMSRSSSEEMKYHFYNLDSSHPIPISEDQIIQIKILNEKFDPENIVHWTPNWNIARDWGMYS